jgi:hypothetical protein
MLRSDNENLSHAEITLPDLIAYIPRLASYTALVGIPSSCFRYTGQAKQFFGPPFRHLSFQKIATKRALLLQGTECVTSPHEEFHLQRTVATSCGPILCDSLLDCVTEVRNRKCSV